MGIRNVPKKMFPLDHGEGITGDVYTYLMPGEEWFHLCDLVEEAVCCKKGIAKFDWEKRLVTFLQMTVLTPIS